MKALKILNEYPTKIISSVIYPSLFVDEAISEIKNLIANCEQQEMIIEVLRNDLETFDLKNCTNCSDYMICHIHESSLINENKFYCSEYN